MTMSLDKFHSDVERHIPKSLFWWNLQKTFADIGGGLRRYDLWIYLGWREVRKHYSRSVLGPFWLTLSMGVLVGTLGVLYAEIFKMDISTYLPFLAVGFIMWALIGTSISSSCTVFSSAANSIRQVRLPLSVYMLQFVWMQFITFAHNFVIYIIVAIFFGISPNMYSLLEIPALFLVAVNILFCVMLLGPLSARFRDIPMIVGSLVQIAFFVTPILWSGGQMPKRAHFLGLNPFYHFMEIVRQPLLAQAATWNNWIISIAITAVFGVIATLFFSHCRGRIAYWV